MNIDHPLLPVVIQRFFSLYFGRPDVQETGVQSWAVGQLIMTSCSSLSALLKRLALGWKDAMERFKNANGQTETCFFLTSDFFQSCCLWLDDVKLLEPNVYLPSLGPIYNPARLLQLFQVHCRRVHNHFGYDFLFHVKTIIKQKKGLRIVAGTLPPGCH